MNAGISASKRALKIAITNPTALKKMQTAAIKRKKAAKKKSVRE